ncbi:CAP domain-containing protein [Tautonia plasticadhaerens]|uniref:SCP domain-containing protein n=1 Tax=Tautonia plasticadhaerens TaxID=2527974 RepID=A0A518GX36_9BACT|nr:CAP domain-containing protein [Tautonia plasticadhaerens]QDV33141.1 hypothetical protein ElP_09830 [Tautonia plasticadhaerens]
MNRTTTRVPARSFILLALTLVVSAPAARPAIAAESTDPLWGLMTVLIRATAPDGPVVPDETPALRSGDAELRGLLEGAVRVAQQPVQVQAAQPTYAPRYQYQYPVAPGGYRMVQNPVNAAVTYWTGQPAAQPTYAQPTYAQPAAAAPAQPAVAPAQPAAAQPATAYGDPYGFTAWLNGVRAQYGLSAVSYDANLSAWANANNAQQNSQGMGHHVMGPARRQNSAMGSAGSIGSQWLASPAHAAALLDPSIRVIGIAGMGAYWTFNAY